MSKKNKDSVFILLRQILAEQKKQTKILQAIESSKEQEILIDEKKLAKIIHNPKSIINS